ncbi:MAG TPA: hypothetical protein VMD59_18320 [Acidimicrobiales bacterium]|nr:hypothetical protein [Acidimicrobiales bacterium]
MTISSWRRSPAALALPFALALALVLVAATAAPRAGATAAPRAAGPSSGAAAEAAAVNISSADLPSSVKWASSPQSPNNKAENAAGRTATACLDRAGAVTKDPFGTSGMTGGPVLADVRSPQFYDKADSLTQLPAANSEVVVVQSSHDATEDLAALRRHSSLVCMAAQFRLDSEQSGSGNVTVDSSFESAPRHGEGSGGVHVHFVESGGLLPGKLYNDEYFYAEGRFEVAFSFLDLGSPFSSSWAEGAISKVMDRAAKKAG